MKRPHNFHDSIRLYGAARCHKTDFYQHFLQEKGLRYIFFDVEEDEKAAQELIINTES